MAELQVSIVSADHEVWTGTASMVVARTLVGEIGILAGHQPLLAILGAGEVRITTEGARIIANAEDGFLSVDHDNVTIVASNAELVS